MRACILWACPIWGIPIELVKHFLVHQNQISRNSELVETQISRNSEDELEEDESRNFLMNTLFFFF